MNGGTGKSGDGSRVPAVAIPAGVRKTIENIKEIASNHSDEEVYAMLRECSMDPNETCQKLLLQDTFHEVRRRRDKKKEGGNREAVDPKNRPAAYGRVGRFSSRFLKGTATYFTGIMIYYKSFFKQAKVCERGMLRSLFLMVGSHLLSMGGGPSLHAIPIYTMSAGRHSIKLWIREGKK